MNCIVAFYILIPNVFNSMIKDKLWTKERYYLFSPVLHLLEVYELLSKSSFVVRQEFFKKDDFSIMLVECFPGNTNFIFTIQRPHVIGQFMLPNLSQVLVLFLIFRTVTWDIRILFSKLSVCISPNYINIKNKTKQNTKIYKN